MTNGRRLGAFHKKTAVWEKVEQCMKRILLLLVFRLCHDSGGLSLSFQRRGPVSFSNQQMLDLRRTNWQQNNFIFEYFSFRQSLPFHQCSVLIFIYRFLLPGGKMYLVWKSSRKLRCFRIRKHLLERFMSLFVVFKPLILLLGVI